MELSVNDLKEIICQNNKASTYNHDQFWMVGKKYYIKTVTKYYTGELVSITDQELVLKNAAWIADTGRLNEAMKDPNKFSEVEPYAAPILVGRGAIVGAQEIQSIITSVK